MLAPSDTVYKFNTPWLVIWGESFHSASMSSNNPLITTRATDEESEAKAVPHLVLTVPSIKLNISTHMASNWDAGWDDFTFCSLEGLLVLVNQSMAFCCSSTKANKCLIYWLWTSMSFTCWRWIWKSTDTCSHCVISSSIISACSDWSEWPVVWASPDGYSSQWQFVPTLPDYGRCFAPDCPPGSLADRDRNMLYLAVISSTHSEAIFCVKEYWWQTSISPNC